MSASPAAADSDRTPTDDRASRHKGVGTYEAFGIMGQNTLGHRRPTRRLVVTITFMLAMAFASALLAWWLDPALSDPVDPGLVWRNALPWFLIMVLLHGLSGRPVLALTLGSALTVLIYQVNGLKQFNLDTPLLPSDLILWQQLLHNAGFFAAYTGHNLRWVLAALVVLAALMFVAFWLDARLSRPRGAPRIALTALALVALVTMYRGDGPWHSAYGRTSLPDMKLWDAMRTVQKVGFAAFFVRALHEAHASTPPTGVSPLVVGFAQQHAHALQARQQRPLPAELPDIVIVQSEAFFDPGLVNGLDADAYMPNFKALAATGIAGRMGVRAYGGGTIRTEFEVLTGYPMSAFPAVAYPYYGLAAEWMPSVPRRLAAWGYTTAFLHPFRADFWNRKQVIPQLGFDEIQYEDAFATARRAGRFVSDQALFDHVLAYLDENQDTPQFVMAITMQNHGPWNADAGRLADNLKGHALPAGLSADGTRELTYYLAHLVSGDAALGDFARRLLARPRPTVLVFYGDHLPSLAHAFADLGFVDARPETRQPSDYMLLSNRPLTPRRLDIEAFQLPGLLFDVLDLPVDGYLAIEAVARESVEQGPVPEGLDVNRVPLDAAQMEVACGRALSSSGHCE